MLPFYPCCFDGREEESPSGGFFIYNRVDRCGEMGCLKDSG